MSPQRKALKKVSAGRGLDFKQIKQPRVERLLDRWAVAEQGRKLKPNWKVELLTDPYLHKGNLGVVAITRPDGEVIYRGRTAGEYPLENDKRQARVRVELHRHTHRSPTGAIRLNTQGVLAILEEVAVSHRATHARKPTREYSFEQLKLEARRHTFDTHGNLLELVHHVVRLFGNEVKYRRAIRDMVRDPEMHTHLRALNALTVRQDERHMLPEAASKGLASHLIPVLDYLERKQKHFKREK
ncbi:MAG: hypothetical protein IPJ89_05470 [Candidatus Iainarchaeum archaeon]|uniref:Uncharacterized protein n=1 Tax=Candidatus Iainarchaeum sp. TaxID=3101447 RepID=A0A7T9DJT9_9ARCH|nr:MAG: hypothetical protein IPJ89_05470 [Candidatus Diapherotrites archaeon]